MISKIKRSRKKRRKQKNNFDFTINQALVFSAAMVIIFTIIMIYCFWKFQLVPDSLVIAFFGAFGLEGGYCAFIHKLKKEREAIMDKETLSIPDEPDDGNLEIDLSEEGGDNGLVDK